MTNFMEMPDHIAAADDVFGSDEFVLSFPTVT